MSEDKNVLYGGPDPNPPSSKLTSLGEFVLQKLETHGDKIAFIDGVTGDEITYTELKRKTIELAECLKSVGVQKGDVIGLCSENRLEFPVPLFAAFCLGITVAPLNLTYTERELNHALSLSKPKVIFTSPYVVDRVAQVAKENSFIKAVIVFADETTVPGVTTLPDFINKCKSKLTGKLDPVKVNIKEHVALVMCSSGTTGLPKGVQLTHFNLIAAANFFDDGMFTVPIPRDQLCFLGVIPWFHAFGCLTLLGVACNGVKLVLLPKFEEGLFLSCIENYKVTIIFMVPPLMVFLAKHPMVDAYDLSSLREVICGAAPLSKEVEDAVYKRIGIQSIRQGYGMSETALSVLVQKDEIRKPGSVGSLNIGCWGKVIDPETGKSLGPNQPGELCFQGTQIMKGYINDEKATSETIDKEGWLHTGDIGFYDQDKQFFIIDRLKELIKYKGYQVPPAEIEGVLLNNPKIKDAAVIGVPDEDCGELPLAFIVKQDGVAITEEEIIKYVSLHVSAAKRLHGGVRFIDEIPKNMSGKILRRELRDLLKKPVAKL